MEAVIVALIGLVGAVIVARIEKGRKENAEDHNTLLNAVNKVEHKIDKHIAWHLDNAPKPKAKKKA